MPEVNVREAMLNRISAANPSVNASTRDSEYNAIPRSYQHAAALGREAILRRFSERLHEYDARVYEAMATTVPELIAASLNSHGQTSAVVANGFRQQHLPEGFAWQMETAADADTLNSAQGAITGCEVAIAHTGTIVIKGVRKITLLPDRLLCVVHEKQIVETVPEAISRLQPFATEALTFISGPSATADIEMTRICGVHGPRFLDVVLVTE